MVICEILWIKQDRWLECFKYSVSSFLEILYRLGRFYDSIHVLVTLMISFCYRYINNCKYISYNVRGCVITTPPLSFELNI